ncbi:MAG TPA: thioredoxin domain-containing protein [Chitinophagaceae bacterium]|nr:thioredoxin domain-containing protein [Chitinophagaceae bacterium]
MKPYLLIAFFLPCLSCHPQPAVLEKEPAGFEQDMRQKEVQLLDVRTAAEFASGHIAGALQANWNDREEFAGRVQYLDKNKPVYIYCLVGGRSAAAAAWMKEKGFTNIVELKGGINAWKAAGKQLEGKKDIPQLTMQEYEAQLSSAPLILVNFGAAWCPPCVKMEPVLAALEKENKQAFSLLRIDGGIHTTLMQQLQVSTLPTFIIYKNGKETGRKEGVVTKEDLLFLLNRAK